MGGAGNAKTLMIVNVSPLAADAAETKNSLEYATRVKQVPILHNDCTAPLFPTSRVPSPDRHDADVCRFTLVRSRCSGDVHCRMTELSTTFSALDFLSTWRLHD